MSDQSHSAQVRAARIVGIVPDRIRVLPTDTSGRIDPGEVAEAIAADRSAGCTPMVVCANAGTPTRCRLWRTSALPSGCGSTSMRPMAVSQSWHRTAPQRSMAWSVRTRSTSTHTSGCSSRTRPAASWSATLAPLNAPSRFSTTCCRIRCGARSTPTWRTRAHRQTQ